MPVRPPFPWQPGEITEARAMLDAGKSRRDVCEWFGCSMPQLNRALRTGTVFVDVVVVERMVG